MKKIAMLLLTGLVISLGSMAQNKDIRNDKKVLQNTIKDKKEDKHEAGRDLSHLKIKSALKERREVRRHGRSIRRQGRHLQNHGVRHPIEKAKRKVKEDKEIREGKN